MQADSINNAQITGATLSNKSERIIVGIRNQGFNATNAAYSPNTYHNLCNQFAAMEILLHE